MSTAPIRKLTVEEYLEFERASELKHEFYRGEVFAMTGAGRNHNRIGINLATIVNSALASGGCEAFVNDMRVKVDATGLYTYPDLVATCDEATFEDNHVDTLLNPQLVIEILSDSTEKYDRGDKFAQYRNIASLREYVLVSQNQPRIEVFTRQCEGSWLMRVVDDMAACVALESVGVTLNLADVYARVEFKAAHDSERR